MASHKANTPAPGTLPLGIADSSFPLNTHQPAVLSHFVSQGGRFPAELIYPVGDPLLEKRAKEEIERLNTPIEEKVQKRQATEELPDFDKVKKKKVL